MHRFRMSRLFVFLFVASILCAQEDIPPAGRGCGRGRARREVVRSQLRLLSRGKGARRRRAQSGPLRGGAARREARFRMGAMMSNGPSTYMPNGSQYLLVAAGDTLFAFKLAGERK